MPFTSLICSLLHGVFSEMPLTCYLLKEPTLNVLGTISGPKNNSFLNLSDLAEADKMNFVSWFTSMLLMLFLCRAYVNQRGISEFISILCSAEVTTIAHKAHFKTWGVWDTDLSKAGEEETSRVALDKWTMTIDSQTLCCRVRSGWTLSWDPINIHLITSSSLLLPVFGDSDFLPSQTRPKIAPNLVSLQNYKQKKSFSFRSFPTKLKTNYTNINTATTTKYFPKGLGSHRTHKMPRSNATVSTLIYAFVH